MKGGDEEINLNISNFKIKINEDGFYVNDELWSDEGSHLNIIYMTEDGNIRVKNIDLSTEFDRNYYNYSYR